MSRFFSRLSAVVLVLALLVGMTTVALASPPAWAGHGNDDQHDKGNKHYSSMFGDTSLEDYPWAFKHIEKMAAKGIVKGLGNGIFNGNSEVKHQEAVTMIVRYMNLEDEAQAAMGATLPFSDAKSIASWARGYVKVALDENLLWMPDSSQMTLFEPNAPTKRVEAVVMLVKAAGLEPAAEAKMHQHLTFRDAAAIPAGYIGYVAVAVENGLVQGYDDNTFQPFKPVKRAEMATFIGRTDDSIPHHGDDDAVDGTFVSATGNTITVDINGHRSTLTLAANCPVYINDQLSALADLQAGDKVELELDSEHRVIFIDAECDNDHGIPVPGTLAGTVKAISIGVGVPSTLVVRLASNAGDKTFVIASNCVIKVDGVVVTAADIEVGDNVTLRLISATSDQLVEILITRYQITSVAGIVKGLTLGTNSSITVRPDNQTTNVTYGLAANGIVKVNGLVSSFAQAGIVVGDRVELKLSNTQVTEINVVRNQATSVAGIVKGLTLGASSSITVRSDSQSANATYSLAANCVVKVNGAASSFAQAQIVVGDRVELKLSNTQVTEINVVRAQTSTVTGTVKDITINTGTYSTITLLPAGQTTNVTYLMANTVVVKYNTTAVAVTDIKVGDRVTLTLTTQSGLPLVTQVVIASRETTASGTVTGINYDARTLTVTRNSVATTYTVAATAVVTLLDQSFTWNQVALNDVVTLTILDSTVTKINITVHNTSYIGTVKSVTVDATGNHFTATIAGVDRTVDVPATASITHAGQPATFADITIGATVVITGAFDGTKIIAAQIAIQ